MNFYKSTRWIRKRENILRRDNYLCQECKRYGKTTPATTVHHIYPLETHYHLRLISDNLISLCNECHNSMHDRNTNVITDVGKRWQERVAPHLQSLYFSL